MRFQKLLEQFYSKAKAWATRKKSRGQSLVELALFLPVLLILLSGLVEFGFGLNQYINVVEATREGARFGVDGDPGNEPFKDDPARADRDLVADLSGYLVSDTTCQDDPSTPAVEETTRDYYGQIACIVQRAADPITLTPSNSDIIITVVRTYRDAQCDNPPPPPTPTPDPNGVECQTEILPEPYGFWPYMITQVPSGMSSTSPGDPTVAGRWQLYNSGLTTQFDRTRIQNYLSSTPIRSQSSAGVLIVETYYNYEMLLKLPWITQFVPDPILFYTYTIVPLPAAEPRPTPTPTFTPSPTFTPTPIPNPVLRINAGGPTYSSWQDDTGTGGTTSFNVTWSKPAGSNIAVANTINTAFAPNAGVMEMYQTAYTGAGFSYTLDNLLPNEPYLLRLHFSENWDVNRSFGVSVNGTPWWPTQTIASVAGGMFTAYILDVDTTADGIGQIIIQFTPGSGNPIINGIELVGDAPAGDCPGDPSQSNWAFGQVTLQSSRVFGDPATISCRAADGNTDGAFANGSVARTNINAQAWWQVDLGQTRTIYEVRLWNTTDGGDVARGTDLYVILSDTEVFSLAAAQALQATGNAWVYRMAGEMNAGAQGPTRVWVGGQDWRYVRVMLAGTNALHLAEVEVSGDPLTACGASDVTNYAQGQPASVSRLGVDACLAADGITGSAAASSARADGSQYNTNGNFEQGFWQVDLGAVRDVGRVTLYASTDAPGNEHTNLYVLLSTNPFTSTNLAETLTQPGVVALTSAGAVLTSGTNFDTAGFTPVSTRYIRVQRSDAGSGDLLTLAEVRVEATAPTPTPTLTPTPICLPGVVDPLTSRIQIQNSPTWSDNESLLNIQVFLLDNCGTGVADNRPVTLASSRAVSDTITAPNPNSAPIGGYIYQYTVRSNTVGTSVFTATVGSLAGGTGPIVAITGATNQGQYVCLSGTQAQGSNPKQLAITYANPSVPSSNRRLVQLQVTWQTISGTAISNSLTSISLGNSSNVIWTGNANTPVNIGTADWTSVFRTVASSASRNLLLDFANQVSPPSGSQWRYTITATWDNGFNASYCNSLPVVITLP